MTCALGSECRRLGLNPQDYFTAALTRVPAATTSDVAQLTPEALAPLLSRSEPASQVRAA